MDKDLPLTVTRDDDDGYRVSIGSAEVTVAGPDLVAILACSLRRDDVWEIAHA